MSRLSISILLPCLPPSEVLLGWQSCSIWFVAVWDEPTLSAGRHSGVPYQADWDGTLRDGHVVLVSVPWGVRATPEALHLRVLSQVHAHGRHRSTTRGQCLVLFFFWIISYVGSMCLMRCLHLTRSCTSSPQGLSQEWGIFRNCSY